MGKYSAVAPDGVPMVFTIEGDVPTAAERARIQEVFQQQFPWYGQEEAPKAKARPGLGELFMSGAKSAVHTAGSTPETFRALFGDVEARRNIGEERPDGAQPMAPSEIGWSPSNAVRFLAEQGAYMAGNVAPPVAAGAAAGSVIPGVGTAAGAAAGLLYGASGLGASEVARQGMARQMAEGTAPEDVSGSKAALAAAVAGGSGLLTGGALARAASAPVLNKIVPSGVGRFLAEDVGTMAPQALEAAAGRGMLRTAGREAVIAGGINAAGGAATEAALRAQAGQSLTDREGLGAIGEAAVSGGAMGAALGAPLGALGAGGARRRSQAEIEHRQGIEAKRQAALAEATTAEARAKINAGADAEIAAAEALFGADDSNTTAFERGADRMAQREALTLAEAERQAQMRRDQEVAAAGVKARADAEAEAMAAREAQGFIGNPRDEAARRAAESIAGIEAGASADIDAGVAERAAVRAREEAAQAAAARGAEQTSAAQTATARTGIATADAASEATREAARRAAAEAAERQRIDAAYAARNRAPGAWNTAEVQTEAARRNAMAQEIAARTRQLQEEKRRVATAAERRSIVEQVQAERARGQFAGWANAARDDQMARTPRLTYDPTARNDASPIFRRGEDTQVGGGPPIELPAPPTFGPPTRPPGMVIPMQPPGRGAAPTMGVPPVREAAPLAPTARERMAAPRMGSDLPPEPPRPAPLPDARVGQFGDSPEARAAMERFQRQGADRSPPGALEQRRRMAEEERARQDSERTRVELAALEDAQRAAFEANMASQPGIDLGARARSEAAAKGAQTRRERAAYLERMANEPGLETQAMRDAFFARMAKEPGLPKGQPAASAAAAPKAAPKASERKAATEAKKAPKAKKAEAPISPAKLEWMRAVAVEANSLWERSPKLRETMTKDEFLGKIERTLEKRVGDDPRAVIQAALDPGTVENARKLKAEEDAKRGEQIAASLEKSGLKKKTSSDGLGAENKLTTELLRSEDGNGLEGAARLAREASDGFTRTLTPKEIDSIVLVSMTGYSPADTRIVRQYLHDLWGGENRTVSRSLPETKLNHPHAVSTMAERFASAGILSEADGQFMRAIGPIAKAFRVTMLQANEFARRVHPEETGATGIPTRLPDYMGFYGRTNGAERPSILLTDLPDRKMMGNTFIHEVTHAVTAERVENDRAFRARVDGLLDHIKAQLPEGDHYGLENAHELLAEAQSNTEFQRVLSQIEITPEVRERLGLPEWVHNAWQAVVSSIRRALGLAETRRIETALDAALHMIAEASENPIAKRDRPGGIFDGVLRAMRRDEAERPLGAYTPETPPGEPTPKISLGLRNGIAGTEHLPIGDRVQPPTIRQLEDRMFDRSTADIQQLWAKWFKKLPGVSEEKAASASFWVTRRFVDSDAALSLLTAKARAAGNDLTAGADPKWFAAHKDSAVNYANQIVSARGGDISRFMAENGLIRVNPRADAPDAMGRNALRNMESVEGLVMARSALERNAYGRLVDAREGVSVEEMRPWSGMTDEHAQAVIDLMAQKPNAAAYTQAADMYFDLARNVTEVRKKGGLIPEDIEGMGPDWVPMLDREWRDMDVDAGAGYNVGASMRTSSREDRQARGRHGVSQDDLMKNILEANWAANRRAANNEVAQRLYALIEETPREANLGKTYGEERARYRDDPNEPGYAEANLVPVKFDGKVHWMALQDGRVADLFTSGTLSLKDGPEQIIHLFKNVMGLLRKVNTSMNPDFIITNLIRDQMEVALKASGLNIPGFAGTVRSHMRDAMSSMRRMEEAAQRHEHFEPKTPMDRWAMQMAEDGGRTEIWGSTEENSKKVMKDLFENQNRLGVGKVFKSAIDRLEAMNHGIENGVRLAAYKALMEAGGTREQATSLARTITVDFGQKGDWSTALNSLYLFFNASTMGSIGLLSSAIRSPALQRVLAAGVGVGFANAMMAYQLMGEDESGTSNYMKIRENIRNTNIIIPSIASPEGYFAIPLPHGYHVIHTFGRQLAEIGMDPGLRKGSAYGAYAMKMAANILSPLFPIGNLSEPVNGITPTLLRFPMELYANRDSFGNPINPEGARGHGAPVAPSQNYFNSASPASVAISDWLHRNTGGGMSDHIKGAVEIQPGTIDHFVRHYTGGAGSFLMRAAGLAGETTGVMDRSPLHRSGPNDIPLLRRFYGEVGPGDLQSSFIQMKNDMASINEDMSAAMRGQGRDPGGRLRELQESDPQGMRAAIATKPLIDAHSKLTGEMMRLSRSDAPKDQIAEQLKMLSERRDGAMMQAMKVYNQIMNQ